jgi:hypothetical protein
MVGGTPPRFMESLSGIVTARLAQLLSSYLEASSAYALARLEFAMRHPRIPAPPVLARPGGWIPESGDLPAEGVRDRWDGVEQQLQRARTYLAVLDDRRSRRASHHTALASLRSAVRELDHCVRAVRWLITVEERDTR